MRLDSHAALSVLLATFLSVGAAQITIDPTPKQSLTSFGASGAWWPNDIQFFPLEVQQNLSHFLFSEDGIFLSSYRYNMGADSGDANRTVNQFDRIVGSFLRSDGTYDWSQDQAGVFSLKAARQWKVPYITFFVNAAPSVIAGGATCGWLMTKDKVQAFADYVTTVLSHWTDHGINIKYISPMNEPDYTQAQCGQEGMSVPPDTRTPVVQAIRSGLDNSTAKDVSIIADESSQLGQATNEDPTWLNASVPYISNIAIHNYDFPDDTTLAAYYRSIQDLTGGHAPPVKFTETCCSTNAGSGQSVFGAQYDPTITNALIVARYIWQFLTIVQAQSFDWWSAVANLPCSPTTDGPQCPITISDTSGYNSGLVYIDPAYNTTKDYTLYITKRAWMMKHFAYFHRPGAVRYDVPQSQLPAGVNAIASSNGLRLFETLEGFPLPAKIKHWAVLFINNQTTSYNLSLQLPVEGAKLKQIVQTTDDADWEHVSLPPVNNGSLQFTLPARSLYTLQFRVKK